MYITLNKWYTTTSVTFGSICDIHEELKNVQYVYSR